MPRDRLRTARATLGASLPLLVACWMAAAPVRAQAPPPSPADVLGYELGERFTDVEGVNRYFRTLADASDRVEVSEYGRTPEGRPLIQVLLAGPESRSRLDEILARNRELTDPATPAERAGEIAAANPAVVYFSYGIHGNESSSSEAAMWTAWDLAREAPGVEGVLDSLVVVLDPVVNPDGRDRYVNWYRQARGLEPNSDPITREHREPWPGGRYNHYLFDLNRDWAWLTQPETRARLDTWRRWSPQVHVDFHEMSRTSTYFFFPPAAPINPIYPGHVLEWGRRFGEANAEAFDREGWLYFTEESYDLFYPGYGDTWPSLLGAVGMTYEQAGGGSAGLVVDRPDGTRLTLRDRARHHRTAGHATLRTAARGRTELLAGFAQTHRRVGEGLADVLLVPGPDPGPVEALVRLLRDQGIRVDRAAEAFSADADPHPGFDGRERFPAGTYRVAVRQSRGRLAAALLSPDNPLNGEFSYDITGWSLPYAYGVEAHTLGGAPTAGWSPVEDLSDPTAGGGQRPDPDAAAGAETEPVGYLVRPDFAAAPALVEFLEQGGRAQVVADTFTMAGTAYERGTVFVPRTRNEALGEKLRASGLEGRATAVRSARTEAGADLGSGGTTALRLPRIALVGGRGTRATSFGAHWYFLERTLEIPFDVVRAEDVDGIDLDDFDVVVVPAGSGVDEVLGEAGLDDLRSWIRSGGALVAVDDGARELAGPLADVEVREEPDADGDETSARRPDDALATRRERERERWRKSMPGAVLPVTLDPRHPVVYGSGVAGSADRTFVLSGGNAFVPSADFESPAFFPADLEQVSGVASEPVLERLARGSWLVEKRLGEGRVILFADDPLFRLFWYAGYRPYTNALLLGPAG